MKVKNAIAWKGGAAALGVLGLVIRRMLYAGAYDPVSDLLEESPLIPALWMVMLAAAVLAGAVFFRVRNHQSQADAPSAWALAGNLILAAGIEAVMLTEAAPMSGLLGGAWRVLGWTATICLAVTGVFRARGKKPPFLLQLPGCLFFLVHLINQYQTWSAAPQLTVYVPDMLGCMGLMLYSFYIAARNAGTENLGMHLATGLFSVSVCLLCVGWTPYPALYLTGALWALWNLPRPGAPRPVKKEETDS